MKYSDWISVKNQRYEQYKRTCKRETKPIK